ncbi:UNVERIFIED_CONTAM: hypothetical protein GTU68_029167 [Idotea baltica]|nr:hypothetical protein [Idotea baltica]
MLVRARENFEFMDQRRTIREFSDRPVPKALMEDLIRAASTAPSGAHKQPWTFCLVGSPEIKKAIRIGAEKEEYESYHGRMSEEWLEDLLPFGTDWNKPFLEIVPWIVVVFKRLHEVVDGKKRKNYYVNDSVGLASGMFLQAAHYAGLATLTHTPSPMNFLGKILNRPDNERPFLLVPIGYPAEGCMVPDLTRKPLEDILVEY